MLETFYNTLGFTGALLVSFLFFIFCIFWMAGLAGISGKRESNKRKTLRLIIAVLIPPYPFFWMIWEMIAQKIQISRKRDPETNRAGSSKSTF